MTKASAIKPNGHGALLFTDPADGYSVPVGNKIEHKEADGKPRGKVHVPASADSLKKLSEKFSK